MNREALRHWLDEFAKDNEDPLPANGLVKGLLHCGFDFYDCADLVKVLVGTCDECWKQLRYCKCKDT